MHPARSELRILQTGSATWNTRSCPKFHRLQDGKIVEVDDDERDQFRKNEKDDVITVTGAHPPIVDEATFLAAQQRALSLPSRARGHVHEYLLTGLITCANCGDVVVGTVRSRPVVIDGKETTVPDPRYVCNGTLHSAGGCRQVPIPRDGFERAVLRVLDEEILSEPALVRLEDKMRRIVAARNARPKDDGIPALEKREKQLAARVADGARRLLEVDADLVGDVKRALAEVKADLENVRASLAERRRNLRPITNAEDLVARTLDAFRSMATLLRDPTVPLERRREILRRLLPKHGDERPIQVHIDPKAKKGWRHALKRVVVRHLGVDAGDDEPAVKTRSLGFRVSPAGADEAEHALAAGWELADGLPTWERELVTAKFEELGELVGTGIDGSA